MKVFAILMIFMMMFSIASFAIAESNETDDDSGNDSESDLDDSEEDSNETELDDDNNNSIYCEDRPYNVDCECKEGKRISASCDKSKGDGCAAVMHYECVKGDNSSGKFREREKVELKDDFKERMKNETREFKREAKDLREEFKDDKRENREEYKIKVRGENVTFNYTYNDRLEFMVGKINARTGLNLTVEDLENVTLGQVLRAYLSNGRWAEVKVMPDKASEKALERLEAKCEQRNCTIELKEVGNNRTNSTRLVYELTTEKGSKFLFLFNSKMKVRAQVDAETGEVISSHKPWWAFLASEKDESEEESS